MTPTELYHQIGATAIAHALRALPPSRRDDFRGALHLAFMRTAARFDSQPPAAFAARLRARLRGAILDERRRLARCRTVRGRLRGPGAAVQLVSLDSGPGEKPLELDDPAAPDPRAAGALATREELAAALAALPPPMRAVIEGWARGDRGVVLAGRLGLHASRLARLRREALRRLRRKLEREDLRCLALRCLPRPPAPCPALPARAPQRRAPRAYRWHARPADAAAVMAALALLQADPALRLAAVAARLGCGLASLRNRACRLGLSFRPYQEPAGAPRVRRWQAQGCPPTGAFCRAEGITPQAFHSQRVAYRRHVAATQQHHQKPKAA